MTEKFIIFILLLVCAVCQSKQVFVYLNALETDLSAGKEWRSFYFFECLGYKRVATRSVLSLSVMRV